MGVGGSSVALVASSFVLGALLCAVYDVFRVARLVHRPNVVTLFVSDIIYCAMVSVSMLLLFFNLTYGRVRVFAFVIMLLGFMAWRLTVSRIAITLCIRLLRFAGRLLNLSKMRARRVLKRAARRIYTAFYCRVTVVRSRHGLWKGRLK